jgi:hypothetical protein
VILNNTHAQAFIMRRFVGEEHQQRRVRRVRAFASNFQSYLALSGLAFRPCWCSSPTSTPTVQSHALFLSVVLLSNNTQAQVFIMRRFVDEEPTKAKRLKKHPVSKK